MGLRHSRGVLTKYSSAGQTVSAAASVSPPQPQPDGAVGEYFEYVQRLRDRRNYNDGSACRESPQHPPGEAGLLSCGGAFLDEGSI